MKLHERRSDLFQAPVVLLKPWTDGFIPIGRWGDWPPPGSSTQAEIDANIEKRLDKHTTRVTRAPADLTDEECARMVREARTRIQQNRYVTYVRKWFQHRMSVRRAA